MPKPWLITGGCGFIGVNLVRVLARRGDGVRVLDNLSAGSKETLAAVGEEARGQSAGDPGAQIELMVGDVREPEACRRAADGVEAIVHLAAQTGVMPSLADPKFDCEQNVLGTLNILEAARAAGVKKFVFASSAAPLGEQEPPLHEGKVPRPLSPYGASKLAGEAYCSAYHGSFGLDTVALRFSNAYGPYSIKKGSVIAVYFRQALRGEPLVIYGDGDQTRDFIHAADLAQAVIKAAEQDVGGEIFQIATGAETRVLDLAKKVKALVEKDGRGEVKFKFEPERRGEIRRSVADISKARKGLGYEPRVQLDDGLAETWEWFKGR